MQSDLQVGVGLKRKEFLEQEARVYYRVYREIEQTVAIFAQRNRIGLVLRFNGDEMKEDDRASVLQGVNRAVVYQQGLDITDLILKQCNINTVPAAPAPAPGTTPTQGGSRTDSHGDPPAADRSGQARRQFRGNAPGSVPSAAGPLCGRPACFLSTN